METGWANQFCITLHGRRCSFVIWLLEVLKICTCMFLLQYEVMWKSQTKIEVNIVPGSLNIEQKGELFKYSFRKKDCCSRFLCNRFSRNEFHRYQSRIHVQHVLQTLMRIWHHKRLEEKIWRMIFLDMASRQLRTYSNPLAEKIDQRKIAKCIAKRNKEREKER